MSVTPRSNVPSWSVWRARLRSTLCADFKCTQFRKLQSPPCTLRPRNLPISSLEAWAPRPAPPFSPAQPLATTALLSASMTATCLDPTCKWYCSICLLMSGVCHLLQGPQGPAMLLQVAGFPPLLRMHNTPLCVVCMPECLYPFTRRWTLRLFPYLSYCE